MSMQDEAQRRQEQEERGRRRAGQLLFALAFLVGALILLALLTDQTAWKARTKLFAQPRFWPGLSVAAMVLFGALHLRAQIRQLGRARPVRADWVEARRWGRALEYVGWFLAYVWLVPIIGYLPATLLFAPLLSWRLGYHSARMLWISALFGLGVVVLFKTLLEVRIPGGLVYEYLPGALRSFLILNF